jgi:hypothetical protein
MHSENSQKRQASLGSAVVCTGESLGKCAEAAGFAFAPQAADTDGDFVQGILAEGQYEIIQA